MTHEQMLEQALATLWYEVTQAHFLRTQTTEEILVNLEKRREMVTCLLDHEAAQPQFRNGAAPLMMDHFHTMLKAELAWLERALNMVQTGMDNQDQR
jgi:hypothetical protein